MSSINKKIFYLLRRTIIVCKGNKLAFLIQHNKNENFSNSLFCFAFLSFLNINEFYNFMWQNWCKSFLFFIPCHFKVLLTVRKHTMCISICSRNDSKRKWAREYDKMNDEEYKWHNESRMEWDHALNF